MKDFYQILKEEIQKFLKELDFMDDEPSIADKYYEKNIGVTDKPQPQAQEPQVRLSGEVIGYVYEQFGRKYEQPIPIVKNPKNLDGFFANTRGILFDNGDFYVSQSGRVAHTTILGFLAEHGLVSYAAQHNYSEAYPENFVAVERNADTNNFQQSSAYEVFPIYYQAIFQKGDEVQPYSFDAY